MTTLLGVLVRLGLAVALVIAGQTGSGLAFAAFPVAVSGLVIARRQPANRIGWLLLGCSVVFALYGVATAYSAWGYHVRAGRLAAGHAGAGYSSRQSG
jgi:hypothetical protein